MSGSVQLATHSNQLSGSVQLTTHSNQLSGSVQLTAHSNQLFGSVQLATHSNQLSGSVQLATHSNQFRYRHRAVSVEFIPATGSECHNTLHITYSSYWLQHVSADIHGHHQVVVQIYKERSILGRGLPLYRH